MHASYPELGSTVAGRYRLLRVLGEGGMGMVFEALNLLTEKKVALKWISGKVTAMPEARERLAREAIATGRVAHPNVVTIYDVEEDGGALFLVMELLEGETLDALIGRGTLPVSRLVSLLIPAMRGVQEAHRQGIIHRDIHPGNIFIAQRRGQPEQPKVMDFGISKLVGHDAPALTQVGTTLGTPHYVSFEQLCNPREVDARADVYSFAVILYRALTGRPPFEGASFSEIAVRIGTAAPVRPTRLRADLSPALERVVLWGMERERELRIPDLETFIRELEPFAEEPVTLPVRSRKPLLLGLGLVVLAAGLGFALRQPATKPVAVAHAPATLPVVIERGVEAPEPEPVAVEQIVAPTAPAPPSKRVRPATPPEEPAPLPNVVAPPPHKHRAGEIRLDDL